MSATSISVVVPTHQRRDSVVRALTALAHQDLPAGEFEVVVSVAAPKLGLKEGIVVDAPYARRSDAGRGRAANATRDAVSRYTRFSRHMEP
jgi:hypothetical protein